MNNPEFFIGVDIGSEILAVTVITDDSKTLVNKNTFDNNTDGFDKLLSWLHKQDIRDKNSVICMESTGVYGQALAYFLVTNKYSVCVEPPLKVKRAFPTHGHKNDITDSEHLAEYAYRFYDELHVWKPPDNVLEQLKTLLKTREQLTRNKTSYHNNLVALKREVVRTEVAEKMYEDLMQELKSLIIKIDNEIKALMDKHPFFNHRFRNLLSIPGVGLQLASYMLVITNKTDDKLSARKLSAYLGICPYEHSSGKSIYKRPRSRKNGPASIRKLLYLAAMSLRTHDRKFKEYFLRKTRSGKSGKLVINNIANKLLRIICAVIRSNKQYIDGYVSIHPHLLNTNICA
jgi:transposase